MPSDRPGKELKITHRKQPENHANLSARIMPAAAPLEKLLPVQLLICKVVEAIL